MKKKKQRDYSVMTDAELANVADEIERDARDESLWSETAASRRRAPERAAWFDANMILISIRMPKLMLEVLKAIAEREGLGYQTLMKQWLNERIEAIARERSVARDRLAPAVDHDVAKTRRAVAKLARKRTAKTRKPRSS